MREKDTELAKSSAEPVTVEETKEYDYNNENDASYCPNNVPVFMFLYLRLFFYALKNKQQN